MTASAAVETSTAMKASAEARLPAGGEASTHASVIKTAECAGVGARLGMRCSESVLRGRAMKVSPMKATATIESTSGSIEVIAIHEHSAVGYVAVVIKKDIVVMPIVPPVSPAPAKIPKESDSKAEAPCKAWPGKVQSRIPVPAWPDRKRLSIDEPRIVLRHVNDLWV